MGRLTKRINGIWDADRDAGYNSLDCAEKLAHYEDLEEQGRLIELKCPINTELYFVGEKADGTYGIHSVTLFTLDLCMKYGDLIGKGFYFTKEEAEAKLTALRGE